jgi:hypothetical protein
MQKGHRSVHVCPIGEEADAGMVVVAGVGKDVGSQGVPVGGEGRAEVLVHRRRDRPPEAAVHDVGPADPTEVGVGDEEIELRDRRLHEPGHRRPSGPGA